MAYFSSKILFKHTDQNWFWRWSLLRLVHSGDLQNGYQLRRSMSTTIISVNCCMKSVVAQTKFLHRALWDIFSLLLVVNSNLSKTTIVLMTYWTNGRLRIGPPCWFVLRLLQFCETSRSFKIFTLLWGVYWSHCSSQEKSRLCSWILSSSVRRLRLSNVNTQIRVFITYPRLIRLKLAVSKRNVTNSSVLPQSLVQHQFQVILLVDNYVIFQRNILHKLQMMICVLPLMKTWIMILKMKFWTIYLCH